MSTTTLHRQFLDFAEGMPAIGISTNVIGAEIQALAKSLKGNYPSQPSKACGNIKIGKYGLAFSVFVRNIGLSVSGGKSELTAELVATIHPDKKPQDIIREYEVTTVESQQLMLDHNSTTRTVYWRPNGLSVPDMDADWGPDYKSILATTTIPAPQEDNFVKEIEPMAMSGGQSTFFNLIIDLLPRIDLREIAPWVNFLDPLRISYQQNHIIITSPLAFLEIGGCTPKTIQIEPDPDFPYGQSLPTPSYEGQEVDYAVYFPKTRLVDFTAELIQPAILVDSGRRGGLIKWQASGAIGLKKFEAFIETGFAKGRAKLKTTLGVSALTNFVGAARAWIDGPSGAKIGLANASFQGSGNFKTKIEISVNIPARVVEADLIVVQSELPEADFVFDAGLPWPLDEIIGEIISHVAQNEIEKLTGTVVKLGRWDFFGIPLSYVRLLQQIGSVTSAPYYEGLSDLSAVVGIIRSYKSSELPAQDNEG